MKKLALLIFLISTPLLAQKAPIYKKAKITYTNKANFKSLTELGLALDHGIHKPGVFIISDFSEKEIEAVKRLGLPVDILVEDVAADYLKRNANAKSQVAAKNPTCASSDGGIDYPTPSNFALGSMGGFLTYQEMFNNLDEMHNKYPNLISTRANIGNFVTNGTADSSVIPNIGGNTIQWVRISDNPDTDEPGEPEILYNAITHAREPASLSQLIYFMWYLLENYDSNPEIKEIVDNTELYFVPVVNPDGYLYNQLTNPNGGGLWRKNRFNTHGVDINRNYDHYQDGTAATAIWGGPGATTTDTNSDIYAGASAFSEVESQAMKWFINQHDFTISMDNHCFSELLLLPYGFESNNPTPEGDIYKVISDEMVSQNGYNNIPASDLYVASGVSIDYIYGGTTRPHKKIFSFTPEIGDAFWPTSNQIDRICKEMMFLNLKAAKLVHNYATIEDNTGNYIDQTSFDISYIVKRLGLIDTGESYTVSIIPVSSNIVSVGDPKTYNGFSIGQTQEDFINLTLDNSIQNGNVVTYDIKIESGKISETLRSSKTFGTISVVAEDDANTITNYTNQGWGITNTTFVSSTGSITDSPTGNYGPSDNKIIELNTVIDLSTALEANIQFYAKWDIETNWDYVQFEVSTDAGNTWVAQCGKYTSSGSSTTPQPTDEPLYEGTQNDWVLEEINLNDYIGQSIKVRFQFASDDQVEQDGFYFDDLKVTIIDQEELSTPDFIANNFRLYPNPIKDILNIEPKIQDSYKITLNNIQGQAVLSKDSITGNQQLDISKLSTGIYFLTIVSGQNQSTLKVVKR